MSDDCDVCIWEMLGMKLYTAGRNRLDNWRQIIILEAVYHVVVFGPAMAFLFGFKFSFHDFWHSTISANRYHSPSRAGLIWTMIGLSLILVVLIWYIIPRLVFASFIRKQKSLMFHRIVGFRTVAALPLFTMSIIVGCTYTVYADQLWADFEYSQSVSTADVTSIWSDDSKWLRLTDGTLCDALYWNGTGKMGGPSWYSWSEPELKATCAVAVFEENAHCSQSEKLRFWLQLPAPGISCTLNGEPMGTNCPGPTHPWVRLECDSANLTGLWITDRWSPTHWRTTASSNYFDAAKQRWIRYDFGNDAIKHAPQQWVFKSVGDITEYRHSKQKQYERCWWAGVCIPAAYYVLIHILTFLAWKDEFQGRGYKWLLWVVVFSFELVSFSMVICVPIAYVIWLQTTVSTTGAIVMYCVFVGTAGCAFMTSLCSRPCHQDSPEEEQYILDD